MPPMALRLAVNTVVAWSDTPDVWRHQRRSCFMFDFPPLRNVFRSFSPFRLRNRAQAKHSELAGIMPAIPWLATSSALAVARAADYGRPFRKEP